MEKWREMRISAIPLSKFREKVGERRETWCDSREREKKKNCDYTIAKIRREKKNLQLWRFNCRNMRGIVKKGILEIWQHGFRNLENFGGHKEREFGKNWM